MSSSQVFENQKLYIPASLRHTSSGWHIEYFARHPQSQILERKRIKLNRERRRFSRLCDFRIYANDIVCRLNAKLAGGWSPFMEEENLRYYTSLSQVIEEYLSEKRKELRPATLVSYRSFCKMFGEWCDEHVPKIYMSVFNRVLAVRYLDFVYSDRGVSARTYNNQLKMGRALFAWAKEKCYIKENPFEFVKTKREDVKRRVLIPANTRRLVSDYLVEHNPAFLIVCQLVYTSLIRPKEIRLIQVKHIQLSDKVIFIPAGNAKTHHQRHAALSASIVEYLEGLSLERYSPDDYLFSEDLKPGAVPCGPARFRHEWDKVRSALGLPQEMQLYSFRDTGINNLLKSGVDPLTVMQHADHHDLSMTTRYANHHDPELARKIYEKGPEF